MPEEHVVEVGNASTVCWSDAGGRSALAGVEIPFLPEPMESDRVEAERRQFQQSMVYMSRALYGLDSSPMVCRTFEVRLAVPSLGAGARVLSLFFIVRSYFEGFGVGSVALDRSSYTEVAEDAVHTAKMLVSLVPQRLACSVVDWRVAGLNPLDTPLARCGLVWDLPWVGHLRKRELLSWAPELDPLDQATRLERSRSRGFGRERSRGLVVPAFLPLVQGDLLPVAAVMAEVPGAVVLRVSLQSTKLQSDEYRALAELERELSALQEAGSPSSTLLAKARAAATAALSADGFFRFSAQVLGEDPQAVRAILATWCMEHDRGERLAGVETPVGTAVSAETPVALDDLERARFQFDRALGPTPDGPPPRAFALQQTDSRLQRVATLASLVEVPSLWKLPVVNVGGQAGLRSRPSNPFEQLPMLREERFESSSGLIRAGCIRRRGVDLPSQFILPGTTTTKDTGASILDRVMVVAGSPGSGKTNFAVNVLEDVWRCGVPFLVLDPTLGHEFRAVAADASTVFTVGDLGSNPFVFNPFVVPDGVTVQTHITRLMACFRSAFHMWDPLPAIFEEAIRLAYARRAGERNHDKWNAAAVLGRDLRGRFPTLEDVAEAMGTGRPGEQNSVLARMRDIWSAGGGATENQSTILASTSLRLGSLMRNYGHIIGGRSGDELRIDVQKLLERPVVLELGAIGDGQALSLIASFLLVCIVGCVETRDPIRYHMLVIEEAHRLLGGSAGESGGPSSGAETSSTRAQAADDLNNMLAEVRKYGQGVMILDQRPGSLVGGVIDNAYVVALHRLNERKGFDHLSDMLNLTADQRRFARVGLEPGEAVMFDRLLGAAVLVKPPLRIVKSREEIVDAPGPEDGVSESRSPAGEDGSDVSTGAWDVAAHRVRAQSLAEEEPATTLRAPSVEARERALAALQEADRLSDDQSVIRRVKRHISEDRLNVSRASIARACRAVLGPPNDGRSEDGELIDAMVYVLYDDSS